MKNRLGYEATNEGEELLVVCNKEGNKPIGFISPNDKYVVMDSWISNDNKYINARIKFINYKGQLIYGYLYNVACVKQVSF